MSIDSLLFFSLDSFQHKELFVDRKVWEPIIYLQNYMDRWDYSQKKALPSSIFVENEESIFLGENVIIEPGAYLKGPIIIGSHSTIRSGAYVREYSLIGQNCVVGHGSEIKHSILMDHSAAAHFAYVGDSIVGNGVNLGASVICANLRFDRAPIRLKVDKESIETGLEKLGALIGDGAQIGCNAVLNPGTLLAKEVLIPPLAKVTGYCDRFLAC